MQPVKKNWKASGGDESIDAHFPISIGINLFCHSVDSCPFLVKKITLAWSYECLITEYLYNQRYTKLCEAPCKVRRLAKSAESDWDPGYLPQAASRLVGCLRGHTIQILDLRRLLICEEKFQA